MKKPVKPRKEKQPGTLPLERLRAELSGLSSQQRLKALMDLDDPKAAVRSLPAEDLFYAIKEVGMQDAVEIVQLASSAQFRTFVDLDVWKRDRLDPSSALTWMRAARTAEGFVRKLAALDMELIELVLRGSVAVYDLSEESDPNPSGITWHTPEGHYVVAFKVEGAEYSVVRAMLEELYAQDPFRAARLLEAIRWELPSELEETALRWRSGRLADLGFPDLAEALSFYAYVNPDAPLAPQKVRLPRATGFFLAEFASDRFLDRALARVPEARRERVDAALVSLVNSALVADAADPGDLDGMRRIVAASRDTLSLGLEHGAKGDLEAAANLLAEVPLKRIFQVGVSLALRLKFRADRLLRSGKIRLPGSGEGNLIDPPVGEAVRAVCQKRPRFCAGLEGGSSDETRPFRSREDIARVADAVAGAEELAELMQRLGFEPHQAAEKARALGGEPLIESVRFSDFYATAAARELLGEGFAFGPVAASRLGDLGQKLFQVDGERVSLKVPFEGQLRERLPGPAGKAFADFCVHRLVEELGRPFLASGHIDLKLPGPLLVSLA